MVNTKKQKIRQIVHGDYASCFNTATGSYFRPGDHFYCPAGPEMLDIGITNVCNRDCSYCYTDAQKIGEFISLEDYRHLLRSFPSVYQAAIGGGEPTLHPAFPEILRITREEFDIVPNYSTNGDNLSSEIIQATNSYCGAVAVTCHTHLDAMKTLECFRKQSVTRVAHLLLSSVTIDSVISFFENGRYPDCLDAVMVLLYKPMGRADASGVISPQGNRDKIAHLAELMVKERRISVGFDSCMAPIFAGRKLLPPETFDACEAGRFSLYADHNLNISPCSFVRDRRWTSNLKDRSGAEPWDSPRMSEWRDILDTDHASCTEWSVCLGGCPVFPETNLCPRMSDTCHGRELDAISGA